MKLCLILRVELDMGESGAEQAIKKERVEDRLSGLALYELEGLRKIGIKTVSKIELPTRDGGIRDGVCGVKEEKVILFVGSNFPEAGREAFINHMASKYNVGREKIEFVVAEKEKKNPRIDVFEHFERVKNKLSRYGEKGLMFEEPKNMNEKAVNKIFGGIIARVSEVTQVCIDNRAEDKYLETARTFLALLEILDSLGEGELPLERDLREEKRLKELHGDGELYIFGARDLTLDNNVEIDWVNVLIRPEDKYSDLDPQKKTAQARTRIAYKLRGGEGVADIRIDPPDERMDNNLVIDLVLQKGPFGNKKNLIDQLTKINAVAGHHYPSGVHKNELHGLNPREVHLTIAQKLTEMTKTWGKEG